MIYFGGISISLIATLTPERVFTLVKCIIALSRNLYQTPFYSDISQASTYYALFYHLEL